MSERKPEAVEAPAEVDFSESAPNPYVGRARRRVTINIDSENVDCFKAEAARTGAPHQTVVNTRLAECRERGKRLSLS